MRKIVLLLVGGTLSYLAVVALVHVLYEADPADMKWQERETYNAKQIGQLEFGMSKDDVIRMLGSLILTKPKKHQPVPIKCCSIALITLPPTVSLRKMNARRCCFG